MLNNIDFFGMLMEAMRKVVREEYEALEENKPKTLKLYNSREAIEILGISESTFRRRVKDGAIEALKINDRIRIKETVLQDLLKEKKSLKYRRSRS